MLGGQGGGPSPCPHPRCVPCLSLPGPVARPVPAHQQSVEAAAVGSARLPTRSCPLHRIVCRTGEAPEAFADVVTVNVSREGRSRERYSYVVSSCPPGVSLAVRAPLETSVQPPHAQLAWKEDPRRAESGARGAAGMSPHRWLPEPGLANPGLTRGRTAAGASLGAALLPASAAAVLHCSSRLHRRSSGCEEELVFLPPLLLQCRYNL